MNLVILSGRLVRAVEVKYTTNGVAIVNGSVATSRSVKKPDGQWEKVADFHDFKIFGKDAEYLQKYSNKGERVLLKGELRKDSWVAQDGAKKYHTYVLVSSVEIFGCNNHNQNNNTHQIQTNNYSQPLQNQYQQECVLPSVDIDDEEMPF